MRTGQAGLIILALIATGLAPCEAQSTSSTPAPSRVEPWISKSLSPRAGHKLATAFLVAVQRLRDEPACRGLFQELGAEGLEALAKSLYYKASLIQEQRPCRRGTAFTAVGGRVTRLCRSFTRLPDNQAARPPRCTP